MQHADRLLVIAAMMLLSAVLASKISSRLGVPALLLFLALGMLAGSDGPGGIWFDNPPAAQWIGTIALAIILFAGGLETDWSRCRRVLWQGLSLSTIGVAVTTLLTGWFAQWVLGCTLTEGLLVGAIVSSTDAAAVFSVLRGQRVGLKDRLQSLIEFESGSNDPMAVFLTVALTALAARTTTSAVSFVPLFFWQMLAGAVLGYVAGRSAVFLFNKIRLNSEGLYPVMLLSVILLAYGTTALVEGSGFLAAYIAGIVMGNRELLHKRSLARFSDGLTWLMQIAMFLVLGLQVFPSRLPSVAGVGTAIALFLVFIARPASVFLSLAFSGLGLRQKLLLSWAGLRGAVPIVLATFPLLAGVPRAQMYFDLVFFVVLVSVLLQGTTIPLAARWLKQEAPEAGPLHGPIDFIPAARSSADMVEVVVPEGSAVANHRLVDLHLPKSCLAVLLGRGEDYIVPRGDTTIHAGDLLLLLADKQDIPAVRKMIEKA